MTTQNHYYDRFFARGGWKYDLAQQKQILQNILMPIAGWKTGDSLIEVGAGMCHHAELLRQLGLKVTAVEASSSGVRYAKKHYPNLHVVEADVTTWSPSTPVDHVFARGMSFFHYELNGVNCKDIDVPAQTARMFDWLRVGGHFTLQIVTDFSGRKDSVHMNTIEEYLRLFSRFGNVLQTRDFSGKPLKPPVKPGSADRGIIIVTEKA